VDFDQPGERSAAADEPDGGLSFGSEPAVRKRTRRQIEAKLIEAPQLRLGARRVAQISHRAIAKNPARLANLCSMMVFEGQFRDPVAAESCCGFGYSGSRAMIARQKGVIAKAKGR